MGLRIFVLNRSFQWRSNRPEQLPIEYVHNPHTDNKFHLAAITNLLYVLKQKCKLQILNAKIITIDPSSNTNNFFFTPIYSVFDFGLILDIEIFVCDEFSLPDDLDYENIEPSYCFCCYSCYTFISQEGLSCFIAHWAALWVY